MNPTWFVAVSAFSRLGHVPAELAVSFLVVAKTIASTFVPTRGGLARLSRPGWLG